MARYRQGRVNEEIQKELASILRGVKDPRVSDAFLSVTAVDCTTDLKYAKIYYSTLTGDANSKELKQGLRAATGYIRRELAHTLNLRVTPELTFLPDDSIRHGAHIASILKDLDIPAEEPGESEEES